MQRVPFKKRWQRRISGHPAHGKQSTANGPLSGHGWRGTSDTEVLLAAYARWGTDCLRHLNGMFAFAIHDERRKQLFLARDRAGEKPLFYRLENGEFWFASELKALMAVPRLPRKINSEALDCYLAFGFVPGEMCILEGYRKLPPGHAMTFDLERGTNWIWPWLPAASKQVLSTPEKKLKSSVCKRIK